MGIGLQNLGWDGNWAAEFGIWVQNLGIGLGAGLVFIPSWPSRISQLSAQQSGGGEGALPEVNPGFLGGFWGFFVIFVAPFPPCRHYVVRGPELTPYEGKSRNSTETSSKNWEGQEEMGIIVLFSRALIKYV